MEGKRVYKYNGWMGGSILGKQWLPCLVEYEYKLYFGR